ncbi:hypothetical protein SLE2022_236770 [Rubroshorea leprosula]
MIHDVSEARNLALKAERVEQEKRVKANDKYRLNYDGASSGVEKAQVSLDQNKAAIELPTRKSTGKRAIVEPVAPKTQNTNPYARPTLGKCYKCIQVGH